MLQCRIKHPVTSPLETRIVLTMCIVAVQHINATCFQALVRLSNRLAILLLAPIVSVFPEVAQRLPVEQEHGATARLHWRHWIQLEPVLAVVAQNLAHLQRPQPSALSFCKDLTNIHFRLLLLMMLCRSCYNPKPCPVLRDSFHNIPPPPLPRRPPSVSLTKLVLSLPKNSSALSLSSKTLLPALTQQQDTADDQTRSSLLLLSTLAQETRTRPAL